jgi:hypothetical protein
MVILSLNFSIFLSVNQPQVQDNKTIALITVVNMVRVQDTNHMEMSTGIVSVIVDGTGITVHINTLVRHTKNLSMSFMSCIMKNTYT